VSTVSSLGAGSGLDLSTLLDNLMQVEQSQAQAPLDRAQSQAQVTLSALGSLSSSVASFSSAVSALSDLQVGRSVDSSLSGAVTGTASADAESGSYAIAVDHLASAQSLATDTFADADAALGTGTLTLSVNGKTADIEVGTDTKSLRDVRDAINAADVGVQAVVVQDGSAYRLLLTSSDTGTAGEMTLTVSGTVDTRLASSNMQETAPAQDASFSVNGLTLSSSSNTVDGVVPGVTLQLLGSTQGQTARVDVAVDTSGVAGKLNALVTAYNALRTNMSALGGVSADGTQAGPLVGDSTLQSVQRRVGGMFGDTIDTGLADNPFSSLVDIGLHTDQTGTASLDSTALDAALSQNEAGVEALVSAFAKRMTTALDAYQGADGIFNFRTTQLNTELKDISDQRAALAVRLQSTQDRLRQQFTALDTLVTQFQSTSNYLAQQLGVLGSVGNVGTSKSGA
jgi:flagellar hook-associated protein 2